MKSVQGTRIEQEEQQKGSRRSSLRLRLHFELHIIVDQVIHCLALVSLKDELTLLNDITDDNDKFFVRVAPGDDVGKLIVLKNGPFLRMHQQNTLTCYAQCQRRRIVLKLTLLHGEKGRAIERPFLNIVQIIQFGFLSSEARNFHVFGKDFLGPFLQELLVFFCFFPSCSEDVGALSHRSSK